MLLDDCQWADGVASRLLARWHAGSATTSRHVLGVVAFRTEEVGPEHPLRSLVPTAALRLGSFDEADIAALCESMAGPLPGEALAAVVRLADGLPFMGSAVLRGTVESGALCSTSEGWEVDQYAMGEVRTSRRGGPADLPGPGGVIAEAGDRADGILGKTQDLAHLGERLQLLLPA